MPVTVNVEIVDLEGHSALNGTTHEMTSVDGINWTCEPACYCTVNFQLGPDNRSGDMLEFVVDGQASGFQLPEMPPDNEGLVNRFRANYNFWQGAPPSALNRQAIIRVDGLYGIGLYRVLTVWHGRPVGAGVTVHIVEDGPATPLGTFTTNECGQVDIISVPRAHYVVEVVEKPAALGTGYTVPGGFFNVNGLNGPNWRDLELPMELQRPVPPQIEPAGGAPMA